jgi:hypothetical protein
MADDDTTEDDADFEARVLEGEDCAFAPDYVLQRASAFLLISMNYDRIPEDLKEDARAFLGIISRSIRTYSDKGEVSKLRPVKA